MEHRHRFYDGHQRGRGIFDSLGDVAPGARVRGGSVQYEMRPLGQSQQWRRGSLQPAASGPRDMVRRDLPRPRDNRRKTSKKKEEERPQTSREIFEEKLKEKVPVIDIPISLMDKRKLLKHPDFQHVKLSNNNNQITKSFSLVMSALVDKWIWILDFIEPWTSETKKIEGSFGTGVGSYFRLLRTFLYINISVTLVTFLGLILPIVTDNTIMTFLNSVGEDFSFQNLFLGDGKLETSILFYGSYSTAVFNATDDSLYTSNYSITKG